jgi:hypothetical protein
VPGSEMFREEDVEIPYLSYIGKITMGRDLAVG